MNANMLMVGKIGGSVIVNEDINKFFSAIKDIDWTDNNIYKPAKICEVKPTFSINSNHSYSQGYQSKISMFDQLLIEDNSNHLNDFRAYESDFDDRMIKINEKINTQKKDFIQLVSLEGIDEKADKSKILEAIKNNLSRIVNNTKLKDKVGNLMNAMEQANTIPNNPNIYQNINNLGYPNQQQNFINNPNFIQPNNFNQNPNMMNNQQRMSFNQPQGNFNNFNNMNNYNVNYK